MVLIEACRAALDPCSPRAWTWARACRCPTRRSGRAYLAALDAPRAQPAVRFACAWLRGTRLGPLGARPAARARRVRCDSATACRLGEFHREINSVSVRAGRPRRRGDGASTAAAPAFVFTEERLRDEVAPACAAIAVQGTSAADIGGRMLPPRLSTSRCNLRILTGNAATPCNYRPRKRPCATAATARPSQTAMDLLMRYGEALGAERLVETHNVCGTVSATTPFMRDFALPSERRAWTRCSPSSASTATRWWRFPRSAPSPATCSSASTRRSRSSMGVSEEIVQFYRQERGDFGRRWACRLMNTCTPYQVGNMPDARRTLRLDGIVGRRLLQLGAGRAHQHRGPREHRRRDAHRPDPVLGLPPRREPPRHPPESSSTSTVDDVEDWGLLGYCIGELVQERVPVIDGRPPRAQPAAAEALRRCRFLVGRRRDVPPGRHHAGGADAARRPSAATAARDASRYGAARAPRAPTRTLNATGTRHDVDYVMLGCPHYTHRADLGGRAADRGPQGARQQRAVDLHAARDQGTGRPQRLHQDHRGRRRHVMTDSCSAMSRACRRARRSRRSTRPSRRTTCRRSWACRPGSAPRPSASMRPAPAAGTGGYA